MDRFKTARRAMFATLGCVGIATAVAVPQMWQPVANAPSTPVDATPLAASQTYPGALLEQHVEITPVKFNFQAPPLPQAEPIMQPGAASMDVAPQTPPVVAPPVVTTPGQSSVLVDQGVRRLPPIDASQSRPSRGSSFVPNTPPTAAQPAMPGKHRFEPNQAAAAPQTSPFKHVSRSGGFNAAAPSPVQHQTQTAAPIASRPSNPVDPAAMAAVTHRANQLIAKGFSLAPRGAHYSARANFIQSLRIISQALDANQGGQQYTQALARGLRALEEAGDFTPKGSKLEADLNVASIISSHRTVALKDHPQLQNVTPLMALQQYYTYAQQQLAYAGGKQPASSRALYGLGKLEGIIGGNDLESKRMAGPRSMAYYQAAMMTDPTNSEAANELGVLLAKYGQWQDARAVLIHSLSKRPTAVGWHNIAVVHDHLRETDLATKARYEMQLASRQQPARPGVVQWVSAKQFAQTNPGPAGVPPRTAPPRVEPAKPGDGKTANRPEAPPWWAPWRR